MLWSLQCFAGAAVLFMALGACAVPIAGGAQEREIIEFNSDRAPPLGPYSSAVRAGDLIFVSGVLAFDHESKGFAPPEIGKQTELAFDNLDAALVSAGAEFGDIVKISVFLRSPSDIAGMNAVYEKRFSARRPARTLVSGADWGRDDILIEIDAVALCRGCD